VSLPAARATAHQRPTDPRARGLWQRLSVRRIGAVPGELQHPGRANSTEGILGTVIPCTRANNLGHLDKRGFNAYRGTATHIVCYNVEDDELGRDTRGFLNDVGVNELGELVYCINQLEMPRAFQGFYSNERDIAKKVPKNAFARGGAYFCTGDLPKLGATACWYFVDFLGDTSGWIGENVSTNEVAEALTKYYRLKFDCVNSVYVLYIEGHTCMAAIVFDDVRTFYMCLLFETHF
jgi:acyl-CoA synthetase (AMP-forming)/AMP-acid ligase II